MTRKCWKPKQESHGVASCVSQTAGAIEGHQRRWQNDCLRLGKAMFMQYRNQNTICPERLQGLGRIGQISERVGSAGLKSSPQQSTLFSHSMSVS